MERKTDQMARRVVGRLRGAKLDQYLVAAFTGGKPSTVHGWLHKDSPPRGEMLNRLQVLLYTLGVPSPELDRVTPYGLYLARLMAFNLVTIDEAQLLVGAGYKQAVFETIRGERDPYDEAVVTRPTESLQILKERFDVPLAEAEEKLRKRFADPETSPGDITRDVGGITPQPQQNNGPTVTPAGHDQFLAQVASKFAALIPLARHLLEHGSAEDRQRVRQLMGDGAMFDLSNLTIELCSERARIENQGR